MPIIGIPVAFSTVQSNQTSQQEPHIAEPMAAKIQAARSLCLTGEQPARIILAGSQQLLVTSSGQTILKVATTASRTHVMRPVVCGLRITGGRHLTKRSPCVYTIVAPLKVVLIPTANLLIYATTTLDVLSRGARPSKTSTTGSVPTTTILAFI